MSNKETIVLKCPVCTATTYEGVNDHKAPDDPTCSHCNTRSLLAHCRDEKTWPAKEMSFRGAYESQVLFVRDELAPMVIWRQGMDFKEIFAATVVVGQHISKSITLPVYRLEADWATIILRDNFHDWNVAVLSKCGPILFDDTGLLSEGHAGYLFWQGMRDYKAKCKPWPESKENFAFCVTNRFILYTLLFLMKRTATPL